MKKITTKNLSLSVETIRQLDDVHLKSVAGGQQATGDAPCGPTAWCTNKSECNCMGFTR